MGTCAVRSGGTNSGCAAKTTFDTCNNEDIGTCAVKAGGTNYGCTGKTTMGTCTGTATGQGNYGVTVANACVFTASAAHDCVFTAIAANACEFTPTASNSGLPSCPATQISTATNPGVAVPTPGCSCGWDKVAVPAGKFCGLKADGRGLMMPDAFCPTYMTDGKTMASAQCNCGTESLVPISAGQFCLVSTTGFGTKLTTANTGTTTGNTGTNSELPSCPATQISTATNPGVAVPTPGCSCGWDKVAVPAGKFCGLKADGRGL